MPTLSRRGLAAALASAALLATSSAAAPSPQQRRKKRRKKPKFRTITKTFTNGSPIEVVGGGGERYPSTLPVSGFKHGKVLDVNVTLRRFEAEIPGLVHVLLLAPNGRRALIMSNTGNSQNPAVSDITLILDDQAAVGLPDQSRLGSGRFKPTNFGVGDLFPPPAPAGETTNVKLATFTGINPNGIWRLFVNASPSAPGSFVGSFEGGWSLTIKARVRK